MGLEAPPNPSANIPKPTTGAPPVDQHAAAKAVYDALAKNGANLPTKKRAVQIRRRMWLGGFLDLSDTLGLKKANIKYVLNCAQPNPQVAALKEKGYITDYLELNARDEPGYPILKKHWTEANAFLRKCAAGEGSILIHCHMGVNRSATIVTAHLVMNENWSLIDAVSHIARQRGCVLINESFRQELVAFSLYFRKPILGQGLSGPGQTQGAASAQQPQPRQGATITPPTVSLGARAVSASAGAVGAASSSVISRVEDHCGVAPMDLD